MTAQAMTIDGFTVSRLHELEPELLGALVENGRESLGDAALDEWMLPVVAAWGLLFIAQLDDDIIGSAQVFRCFEDGDLYLDCFYVRPPYRRRSLGALFLREAISRMGQQGHRRLLATVAPGNGAAIGLFQSVGFEQIDDLRDFYGSGRSRLLMAVALGGGDAV